MRMTAERMNSLAALNERMAVSSIVKGHCFFYSFHGNKKKTTKAVRKAIKWSNNSLRIHNTRR